jgi:hypothetical protein
VELNLNAEVDNIKNVQSRMLSTLEQVSRLWAVLTTGPGAGSLGQFISALEYLSHVISEFKDIPQ